MTRRQPHLGIRIDGTTPWPLLARAALLLCAAAALLGCDEGKACERQRMDVAKAWQEVNKAAEDAKLAGGDELQWANIQKKLAVLQSAFATSQVTWDSASKNKDEATVLVGQMNGAPAKTEIFRGTFNAAGTKQAAYYDSCH